jgi:hypothetical protein
LRGGRFGMALALVRRIRMGKRQRRVWFVMVQSEEMCGKVCDARHGGKFKQRIQDGDSVEQ